MPFIWILITWKGFDVLLGTRNIFLIPKRMVAELAEDGFKTVVIIDPGIKIDKEYWYIKRLWKKIIFVNVLMVLI
jgi:alpha-glucosidase